MCNSYVFETPLGKMQAHGDDHALTFLGFIEDQGITQNPTAPLLRIEEEIQSYFQGKTTTFTTRLRMEGTAFQKKVWQELQKIPFGKTASYKDIASRIQNPLGCRAVGNANGLNCFVILIPCHRVIQANGSLGGYSSGLWRKKWLLNHEK